MTKRRDAVYVRYGTRSYIIDVLPNAPADAAQVGDEIRLARMLHRPQIAQNR